MQQTRTHVVVFGSSQAQEGDRHWQQAREVGRLVAERGLVLVSGGYEGAMGAASRGARTVGGEVLGITTPIFENRAPNPFLTQHREEADYPARLRAMMQIGDGFVVLPGGLGTLSELTLAWCLATIRQLGGPLWVFVDPWRSVVEAIGALDELVPHAPGLLEWVETPAALATALDRWMRA
jgi:uncharacterized protein (TIGR00730 family)